MAPGLRGGLVLENQATTPQRVHDAVAAALRSLNSGTLLEGAVAQKLIGDGHVVVAFNRKEFHGNGDPIGEVDVETPTAIIEVTQQKDQKLDQINRLINDRILNQTEKPVILFAPNYGKFATKDVQRAGGVVVKNYAELTTELAKLGTKQ